MLRKLSIPLMAHHLSLCPKKAAAINRSLNHYCATKPVPPFPDQICEDMAPFRSNSSETGFVWKSRYGEVTVPDLTLDDYVWKDLAKWQHRVALVCGFTGRQYTYGKLRDHCAALACRFRNDFKLNPGDVVAISMPNAPEYAIAVLAALEAGLVLTTINPAYTSDEHARQMEMTETKLVICAVDNLQTTLEAKSMNNSKFLVIAVKTTEGQTIPNGVVDFFSIINSTNIDLSSLGPKTHSLQDLCVLPFSSGTSGLPKGVMLTHYNIIANLEMLETPNPNHTLAPATTNDHQEVYPCVLPFFHIYGFTVLLMSRMSVGAKLVTLPRFEPNSFLNSMTEHKGTFLSLVPPILQFMINDSRCTSEKMPYLRTVVSGAAPIGTDTVNRFKETKGQDVEFLQAFGMSETSPVAFVNHRLYLNYSSIGWPSASTEAKITNIDDPLKLGLDANVCGEIMVRSPSVMRGYLKNPTETEKMLCQDGWLHTGDIGHYDTLGNFYITDRAKELIKVQAKQVAPAELEDILCTHPQVLDAAVIGVKHERNGEAPKAYIVRRDNKVTAKEIQKYIEQKCSKHKWLIGGVQFIDSVPKSSTGKILRRKVKEMYEV